MKKRVSTVIWGVFLILLGILLALRAIFKLEIFFDGWWTLFIILPAVCGLFTSRNKWDDVILLAVGVTLLLAEQNVITYSVFWKLLIPIIIIPLGIKLIVLAVRGSEDKPRSKAYASSDNSHKGKGEAVRTAVFAGSDISFDGESFSGIELAAVFGGIELDLTKAIITDGAVIDASAVFGGIDIFLPDGLKVICNSNSVFGGVTDKRRKSSCGEEITLHINANGVFGGVDILDSTHKK